MLYLANGYNNDTIHRITHPGHLRRTAGFFFDLAANVEANVFVDVADEKNGYTGWKYPNPGESLRMSLRMWARSYEFGCEFGQLCKFGCECRRGDKSLRMSANARSVANVATNVGKRCQPYECRNFCKYLRQKNVCGCVRMSGGGFVFLCASGHEKSGKFSRFSVLSFEVMISYSGSA